MSELSPPIAKSKSLLDIIEFARNKRAFVALLLTLITSVLLFSLFNAVFFSIGGGLGATIGFLGTLLSILIFTAGYSATGYLLTDLIYEVPQRRLGMAFMAGLATLPRIIGIYLMLAGIALMAILAMVIMLFITKIPFIGPVLYFFVFPICIVISALIIFGLTYVAFLCGPAVWTGKSAIQTVVMVCFILKNRIMTVIVQQFLLGLTVLLVLSVLFFALSTAIANTSLLSAQILDIRGGGFVNSFQEMLFGFSRGMGPDFYMGGASRYASSGTGYMIAAMLDMAIIFAAVITLPLVMFTAGNCIIYKNASEGLSTRNLEDRLQKKFNDLKEKTAQASQSTPPPQNFTTAAPPENNPVACPQCQSPVSGDDLFCGSCGHKLKP